MDAVLIRLLHSTCKHQPHAWRIQIGSDRGVGNPHVPAVAAAFVAMDADLAPGPEAAFVASAVDLKLGRVVARLEDLDAAFCTGDD